MANIDVAEAIQKFLEDPARESLQLPSLSSQQRKQAKKLIEAHPEIKSESYGFGQDRQLHLFKQPQSKGTVTETASSECSTSASEGTGAGQSSKDYPALSQGLPVRNTFIHIDDALQDDRIVQSMPHGMFSQCLRSDRVNQDAKRQVPEQLQQTSASEQQAGLLEGSHAIVQGLQKLPVFNGQVALVQGWDAEAGRYNILLASPDNVGSFQHAKVKPENLKPVVV